jgi:hypothetical protein
MIWQAPWFDPRMTGALSGGVLTGVLDQRCLDDGCVYDSLRFI